MGARILLTHSPDTLANYYGPRALAGLKALGEVVLNTDDKPLEGESLIRAAAGCDLVVSYRQSPGTAAVFAQLPGLVAFLRCAIDIRNVDVATASKAGVRASAVEDVLLRGRQTFRLVDGKAAAFEGDRPSYGKSGEPLDVHEWLAGMADKAPHWFEASTGGGSKAGSPNLGAAGKTMTRAAFDALPNGDKHATIKGGMTIVD